MSVSVEHLFLLYPPALEIEMIEAAVGTMPEETSLDVLHLVKPARGFPEEAGGVLISCSLE